LINDSAVARGTTSVSLARRISSFLYKNTKTRLALLLSGPVAWLGLVYIAALLMLLVTAFWTIDEFTGNTKVALNFDNVISLFTDSLYSTVTLRTIGIALAVTIIDVLLALPIAFFMSKVAGPNLRRILAISVLLPLWASYLVKAYAWRSVLSDKGALQWLLEPFGLDTPGYSLFGAAVTLGYMWLPYVILPIYGGLEKLPANLLEASSDLGANTFTTIRRVALPLVMPSIIAGSIFAFSLTLGDYITINIVGGANQMLGNLIYTNVGTANNLPMAAALALVPIAIMFIYLGAVKRTGALNNL
jgi:putative spermidine/putrescine transport system permease protein